MRLIGRFTEDPRYPSSTVLNEGEYLIRIKKTAKMAVFSNPSLVEFTIHATR